MAQVNPTEEKERLDTVIAEQVVEAEQGVVAVGGVEAVAVEAVGVEAVSHTRGVHEDVVEYPA
jgi:hypothetical protein